MNKRQVRSAKIQAFLGITSPRMLMSLLRDPDFRKECGIFSGTNLILGESECSIDTAHLFEEARKIFNEECPERLVFDLEQKEWKLVNSSIPGDLPSLVLTRDDSIIGLPDLNFISEVRDHRLKYLEVIQTNYNLSFDLYKKWRKLLELNPVDEFQYIDIVDETQNNPAIKSAIIKQHIQKGLLSPFLAIPTSRVYYHSLVGIDNNSQSLDQYITSSGADFIRKTADWQPPNGLLQSLFLSSHSSFISHLNLADFSRDDLIHAYEFLVKKGDPFSQLGAIELGLGALADTPDLEPHLLQLIRIISHHEPESECPRFSLLSGLIIFSDSEISLTGSLAKSRPYFRRLASLAHASLLYRILANTNIDGNKFFEFSLRKNADSFCLQTVVDMRIEPRWNPELISPDQLKQEFLGRIFAAGVRHKNNINSPELIEILSGTSGECIPAQLNLLQPYFPGPLEGGVAPPNELPLNILEGLESQLSTRGSDISLFIPLVNYSVIFQIPPHLVDIACSSLKEGGFKFSNIDNCDQLLGVVRGLANLSACTRHGGLADALRILIRHYIGDSKLSISVHEATMICLLAAASRENLDEWVDYVGQLFTELAFGELSRSEATLLHSKLRRLCQIVPRLWTSCSKADAALSSFVTEN